MSPRTGFDWFPSWSSSRSLFALHLGSDSSKVQGLSLDKAVVDIGSDVWDHGQAYVALSRVELCQEFGWWA